ncbi:MAG: alpha/beta hydrolase family protein, partial [Leuconostoc falkenbergense]
DIGYDFTKTELKLDLQNNNISKLWAASPLAYAKHVRTPILLLHGEYDLRTPLGQSEEYFMAIKTQTDTPIELVRLPESFHGVSRNGRPNLRIARIEVMNNWFSKFKN